MPNKGLGGINPKFTVVQGGQGDGDKKKGGGGGGPGGGVTDSGGMPVFDTDDPLRGVVGDKIEALLTDAHEVFNFGGLVVDVIHAPAAGLFEDPGKQNPAMFIRPTPITTDRAIKRIERVCSFRRWMKSEAGYTAKPVPTWAASMVINGGGEHLKPLAGVIRHPVLDAANKLRVGAEGYDPGTQYFMHAPLDGDVQEHMAFWEASGAKAAIDWLTGDWLGEFQFDTPGDAARAIMLCLTLLKSRTTLPGSGKFPGFLVTAPMAATGKTELVECLTLAVTGAPPPFSAFPIDDDAEMNKLLMSIVMSDPSCFVFDNVRNGHAIRSAVLDQFITRRSFQGRMLGTNMLGDFPALAVVIATGNNIEAAEDSATRFLEVRMQPKSDNPQNTAYDRDIRSYTLKHRAKILTAMRAVAMVEHELPQKGRFPGWFLEVAGPVMALTGDTTLLDQWDAIGSTIRNSTAFDSFVERLQALHEMGVQKVWPETVVSGALDEYAELVGMPEATYESATALLDPLMTEAEKAQVEKRRKAAHMRIIKGMLKSLKPWRDQVSGGYRLRFDKGIGKQRKERTFFRVECINHSVTKNSPPF